MPKWLEIGQSLAPRVLETVDGVFSGQKVDGPALGPVAALALYHLSAALNASIESNRARQPAVALALLRQCIEALAVMDAGLQRPEFSQDLLRRWREGQITAGGLRKELEFIAWPAYGLGLWNESWAEFVANLAKSLHPYAHYSPELQQWQFYIVSHDGGSRMIAMSGSETPDPLKLSRVRLLQNLVVWALARTVVATRPERLSPPDTGMTNQLGKALASSKLLFRAADWSNQLLPHVLFASGVTWMDP